MKNVELSKDELIFLKTMLVKYKTILESQRYLLFNWGNGFDSKKRRKQLKDEVINNDMINKIWTKLV